MSNYYKPCQRCGDLAGDFARTLKSSGRLVCSRCYGELERGPDQRVIDDLVARSWQETLELRSAKAVAA